ncbi:hypothetical protein PIB30_060848 [Stylosanthes scabra]|uniref:SKP1 component POZ domain-containing protein n=1 Tax=Stylosanthes scabra TaxID=79078 RepID=A0ABU6VLP2_9FABA|nr:hypothetical protein [Stylosanthes scabra]
MASFRNMSGHLRWCIREVNDCLDQEMGRYFLSVRKSGRLKSEISKAAKFGVALGLFKQSSCDSFLNWLIPPVSSFSWFFLNFIDDDKNKLSNFQRLIKDSNVRLLCKTLYYDSDKHKRKGRYIKIKTSDGRIMNIDRSIISAESVVLKDLLDSVGDDSGVIPLPNVSSDTFTEIKLFLEKKRDFQELVDKPVAHYKGWCKAFINRNRPILNSLHLAAEELQIKSLLDLTTQELQRHGRRHTNEYSLQSFHYFSGISGNNNRSREILEELDRGKLLKAFSDDACEEFKDWFDHIGEDSDKNHVEEFKVLMDSSPDFSNVCYSIYRGDYRHEDWDRVSLKSSDGEAFEMVKSVAVDQSLFLRNLVGHSWDYEDIIVNCTGNVLYQVIDFCHKTYDFLEIRNFRPMEECLQIVDHFEGWMTGFLKRNRGILSHLDMAADYLNIPSILAVTTEEVADLAARIRDETSIWCQKLSFSAMLSSLYVAVAE